MDAALEPSERLRERTRIDHVVDIVTIVLISLAAVATAWCGYQAARWSSLEALDYSTANGTRIQAAVFEGRSNALQLIDVGVFLNYESARFQGRTAFADYIRRRLRPEFRRALDAWLLTRPDTNPHAPLTPFAMPQYSLATAAQAKVLAQRANATVAQAVQANDTSDQYIFVTVLFASVSLLCGVAIKSRYPWVLALSSVALLLFLFSAVRVFHYPIR